MVTPLVRYHVQSKYQVVTPCLLGIVSGPATHFTCVSLVYQTPSMIRT